MSAAKITPVDGDTGALPDEENETTEKKDIRAMDSMAETGKKRLRVLEAAVCIKYEIAHINMEYELTLRSSSGKTHSRISRSPGHDGLHASWT